MTEAICDNFTPIWWDPDVKGVCAVAAKVTTSDLSIKCNQFIHCWRGSFCNYIVNEGGALLGVKLL